jgi:hypothetical protein
VNPANELLDTCAVADAVPNELDEDDWKLLRIGTSSAAVWLELNP